MTADRVVVWLALASGRRRAVEVGIDPADLDRAQAKWRHLRPAGTILPEIYPAGPPNPVIGLPELAGDPAAALAEHLADQHGIGPETISWLTDHEGLVGLVGEHDLDHSEHPDLPPGHGHRLRW